MKNKKKSSKLFDLQSYLETEVRQGPVISTKANFKDINLKNFPKIGAKDGLALSRTKGFRQ